MGQYQYQCLMSKVLVFGEAITNPRRVAVDAVTHVEGFEFWGGLNVHGIVMLAGRCDLKPQY